MSRTNGSSDEIQNTLLNTNPFAENSIRKKDINSRKLLANLGGLKVFHKILVLIFLLALLSPFACLIAATYKRMVT